MKNDIRSALERRLDKKIEPIRDLLTEIGKLTKIDLLYIAGGVFDKKHQDIDIFFANKIDYMAACGTILELDKDGDAFKTKGIVVSSTKNALTLKWNTETVQLCSYSYKSLKDLIESFDFAHNKIGAELKIKPFITIKKIYISDDFILARTTDTTFFTGSNYPLSSMLRLMKFHKRGIITGNSHIRYTIEIMTAIIKRGFHNYDDFKDQLDAVDLGLVPEDIGGKALEFIKELFVLLCKNPEDVVRMKENISMDSEAGK